jgi:hypothetical protein
MIESALSTASHPADIEFIVYTDTDDVTMEDFYHTNAKMLTGQKTSISKMTNKCYAESTGKILMYAADDIVFKTKDWDAMILDTVAKNKLDFFLLHGDDLGQKSKKIATHGFVSRSFTERLGYLLPPYFYADFCDTWITSIADHSNSRIHLKSLIIEHLHPSWGKAEFDETYLARIKEKRFWKEYLKYQFLLPLRLWEISKIRYYKFLR